MFRNKLRFVHILLILLCGVAFSVPGSITSAQADDYFVYSTFTAPGSGLVFAAGGYVEDYGVPETWGDEIQYVYFIQAGTPRLAYKVRVWVTNEGSVDDPTPYIDIKQHPSHYDPDHVGPIEPRHFEIVSTCDVTAYSEAGGWAGDEFHVDATGVYLGPWFGIFKFDHDWNYLGQIAPPHPDVPASLAYDPERGVWFGCSHYRDVYQLSDTDDDGDLMDETWQYIFTSPDYGGSHHDGMEYVGGYLWISDMTSDVIGKWQYDSGTDTWSEVEVYYYMEAAVVEGMGFGANDHFWIGGYGHRYVYELGDEITMYYPIADASADVDSYPPTIPITFDASGSHHTDPEREIVLYEWDFDGDGVYDYSGLDPVTEYAYPAVYNPDGTIDWDATAKCYTSCVRVTDDDPVEPQTDVDCRNVCITAPPWKPIADPNGPYNTRVDQEVCLDGSGSFHPAAEMYEPGHPWYDEIVLWEWDLDNDGEFDDATGEIVCTQWSTEGTYFVCLRVTDGAGEIDEKCTIVVVSAIHDVAVESVIPSNSTVTTGEEVTIDVTVSNLGDYPESFNVTVVYDGEEIGLDNVTGLAPGGDEELQFTWDTAGVPEGIYTVKACADIVPGEIIVDNNCLETTVTVITLIPPRYLKELAVEELQALMPQVSNEKGQEKLGEALYYLRESIFGEPGDNEVLWLDDFHLYPDNGDDVFGTENDAVEKLMEILEKPDEFGASPSVVAEIIHVIEQKILEADRLLAQTAIDEASSGDPELLAEAEEEMAKAESATANAEYDKAVENYFKAWEAALKSIGTI